MEYRINEIFSSHQGEGLLIGLPMNFIRFCSCNLSCSWCDTRFREGVSKSISVILNELDDRIKWVSLTGGEPMLEDLIPLLEELHLQDYSVLLETNGTIFDREIYESCEYVSMDIKPPSSGNPGYSPEAMEYCIENPGKTQVKVVIQNADDKKFFSQVYQKYRPYNRFIIQPEWSSLRKIDYRSLLEEFPDVRVIPQTHKILEVR